MTTPWETVTQDPNANPEDPNATSGPAATTKIDMDKASSDCKDVSTFHFRR